MFKMDVKLSGSNYIVATLKIVYHCYMIHLPQFEINISVLTCTKRAYSDVGMDLHIEKLCWMNITKQFLEVK